MPCGERDICTDDCCKTEIAQQQTGQEDERSDETCSPFCVGSCCAPHLLNQDFQAPLTQIVIVNTVYTQHQIAELPEVSLPIWQPPKLA